MTLIRDTVSEQTITTEKYEPSCPFTIEPDGLAEWLVFPTWRKFLVGGLMCRIRRMRRDDICLYLGPVDHAGLQALITERNTPRKLVWRAEIVLTTADGHGTFAIMRRARKPGEVIPRARCIRVDGWPGKHRLLRIHHGSATYTLRPNVWRRGP
ncbi:hypothetical protein [Roseovarius nitratireducens]|uniref:hypothetical protein n=1 Tax=Roseovarius nitratireducens TaxID=2044597 RepID=UPI001980D6D6